MDFIKKFFKDKTIAFYIALAAAGLSIAAAIIYAAGFGDKGEYMSWLGFILMLLAPAAFISLSAFGFPKWGVAAMALLDFAGLLVSLAVSYQYFIPFMIAGGPQAAGAPFAILVVCAALLAVCSIAANVAAWLRLHKKWEASAV